MSEINTRKKLAVGIFIFAGLTILVLGVWKGLLARSVRIRLSTRARELVTVDGVVCGVRVEADGDAAVLGARRGVVLACGLAETPGAMIHLVERNAKKAAFLREALRVTG